MRNRVSTLDEFFANLDDWPVYLDTVWVSIQTRKISELVEEVYFSATAVQQFEEGSQGLLECSQFCGEDDGTLKKPCGSAEAKKLKEQLEKHCESKQYRVRPGTIDI